MIITLIGITVLVLSIIGLILYRYDIITIDISDLCAVGLIVGFMWVLVCAFFIGAANIGVDRDIYTKQLEYESIVKQVECINTDYEDVSKTTVIQNVYEWNRDVYNTKYWSENPWFSWFWNKRYTYSLKYIEMEEQ